MPGRNSQVARIFTLLNLLEGAPHGLTVAELTTRAKDLGHEAAKRTIYRDLEALAAAGFPLSIQGNGGEDYSGRWTLERSAKISQYLILTCRELFALFLARGMLVPLKETLFYQDLERAFGRIEEKLGKRGAEYFRGLGNELCFEPSPRWGLGLSPDLVETVRACCAEGHVLQVTYASANSANERKRKLGPHYLYFARGSLYLVAEDLEDSTVKVFSLPRMKNDAEMLDQPYDGPVTESEEFFKNSMGVFRGTHTQPIKLEFQPEAAHYVKERRWHASQRTVAKEGGRIELHLEVAITPDLVQWVLGFGATVFVAEPKELQDAVRAKAEATAKLYLPKNAA